MLLFNLLKQFLKSMSSKEKKFNKNLIMTEEEEKQFQSSTRVGYTFEVACNFFRKMFVFWDRSHSFLFKWTSDILFYLVFLERFNVLVAIFGSKCLWKTDDDNKKVRDHCHISQKHRGSAHWSCNVNLQLTKKSSCNISQFKRLWQSFNFWRA